MNISIKYGFSTIENVPHGIITIFILQKKNLCILVDLDDLFKIINNKQSFNNYNNDMSKYLYYNSNNRKIVTLLEFLFGYQENSDIVYIFKNKNILDLRRSNVTINHRYHQIISKKYKIIDFNLGHKIEKGKEANKYKNPVWIVKDHDEKIYHLMFCENDTMVKLCPVSYKKVLDFEKTKNNGNKITFSKHSNGYIQSNINLFIHQIVTGCHGNGKGTKKVSVDHIDGDPLNNTWDNLRVANLHQQLQNSKGVKSGTKRARKHNAQNLPEGWTQEMLPKYVTYNRECYNKAKNLWREFFRIEKHPNQEKQWSSSKSTQQSLESKLSQTVEALEVLSQGIQPKTLSQKSAFPTYITLKEYRGTPHLVYDRKLPDKTRHTLRMKTNPPLKDDSTSSQKTQQLELFKTKIYKKYKVKIV